MGSEKVLKKTAFGGFKKEGVLDYVEQLQAEILSLKKELNNNQDSSMENKKLEEKCKGLEAEIEGLKNQNTSFQAENKKLSDENGILKEKVDNAGIVISDYEAKIAVCENKVAEIEKKFSEIEVLYSKASQTDSKANALMADAVNYSEKVIAKANEKAINAVATAEKAVNAALALVSGASERLKISKANYEGTFDEAEREVENLKNTLSKLSSELINKDGAEVNG